MPQNHLRLEILGASFTFSADEETPYLEELRNAYYAKIKEIQESTGLKEPLKIAILTGYLLCDELFRARKNVDKAAPEEEETLRRTLNLIARLDQALENGASPEPPALYRLINPVKRYDWGSPYWIPRLLRLENPEKEPWAELWMGAHPGSPSTARVQDKEISLNQLIAANPSRYLGKEGAANGGGLPFLFKLLAAAKPLSIQAHPGREQARQGWQAENERGIPQDAPERNYRDANHKPEILCALSPFTAMCGFRLPRDINSLLSAYLANAPRSLQNGLAPLWDALTSAGEGAVSPLRAFLKSLFAIPEETRAELTSYACSAEARGPVELDQGPWPLIRRFAEQYPGDPGILAPLYLNLIHLAPGEAIYLPAGILHAYVEGFGVELMANSDNVLRCGLTSKHVDVDELMKVLYFHPFMPELLKPCFAAPPPAEETGADAPEEGPRAEEAGFYTYPSPCKEFALSVVRNWEGPFPVPAPAIIVVTEGRLKAGEPGAPPPLAWELESGESAFIPPAARPLTFSGAYTLYAASVSPPGFRAGAANG
jgi:mannose-6-phosphate isomerase